MRQLLPVVMMKPTKGALELVDRPLESFHVGESASLTRTITTKEIIRFAELSGDWNDLHTRRSHAMGAGYKNQVAHGQLVGAPISALAGHLLPGKYSLLLEVHYRFLHPVFPGDRLTYRGTITHISLATKVLRVDVTVTNQEGVEILKGSYLDKVRQ